MGWEQPTQPGCFYLSLVAGGKRNFWLDWWAVRGGAGCDLVGELWRSLVAVEAVLTGEVWRQLTVGAGEEEQTSSLADELSFC